MDFSRIERHGRSRYNEEDTRKTIDILESFIFQYKPIREDALALFSVLFWIVLPAIWIYVVVIGGSRVNDSVSKHFLFVRILNAFINALIKYL